MRVCEGQGTHAYVLQKGKRRRFPRTFVAIIVEKEMYMALRMHIDDCVFDLIHNNVRTYDAAKLALYIYIYSIILYVPRVVQCTQSKGMYVHVYISSMSSNAILTCDSMHLCMCDYVPKFYTIATAAATMLPTSAPLCSLLPLHSLYIVCMPAMLLAAAAAARCCCCSLQLLMFGAMLAACSYVRTIYMICYQLL